MKLNGTPRATTPYARAGTLPSPRQCSAFSVWTQYTVPTGKRQRTPERKAISHTHSSASSGAKTWDPIASSIVQFSVGKRALHDESVSAVSDSRALCLWSFSVRTEYAVSTGKKLATRDECHWPHACKSFKWSKGVKPNGIL